MSATATTGALSVSVLVSAAMAIPVGRWLDTRGGRGVMTLGSVLATVAVGQLTHTLGRRNGVASVATPDVLLERYGDQGYATISGVLATPTTIGRAAAPLGAAAVAASIGYLPLILAAAGTCIVSAAALTLTRSGSCSQQLADRGPEA